MSTVDLDHPPEGVVLMPDPPEDSGHLDPRAWVEACRSDVPRRLHRPVADYLAEAREAGEA